MPHQTRSADDLAAVLDGHYVQPGLLLVEQVIAGEPWPLVSPDLDTHLQLIDGVGPWWERNLRAVGYYTLHDLVAHPRFGPDVARCLAAFHRRDAQALKTRGAPIERLVCLFAHADIAFLDIETMGLGFGQELFLIGILRFRGNKWILQQLVIETLTCQAPLLERALVLVDGVTVCITYNGATFDVPFLRAAMQFHGVATEGIDRLFHADLLYPIRRRYREKLPDCRLTTVARQVLGLQRLDDIPGELIPVEYARFLKNRDPAILQRILDHNRDDLLALRELAWHTIVGKHRP